MKTKTNFRGVTWNNQKKKYSARIAVNNNNLFLGLFEDVNKAIEARKKAEKVNKIFYHNGKRVKKERIKTKYKGIVSTTELTKAFLKVFNIKENQAEGIKWDNEEELFIIFNQYGKPVNTFIHFYEALTYKALSLC